MEQRYDPNHPNQLNYDDVDQELTLLEDIVNKQQQDIAQLNKWVRDGNGQAPLLVRVAKTEQFISNLDHEVEEIETTTRQLKASVFSATIALIPALIALTFSITQIDGFFSPNRKNCLDSVLEFYV